jgi:flagellar FliJ protein
MAKFVFTLQPVLDHRLLIEEQRQRELGALLQQKNAKLSRLREMQGEISQSRRSLGDGLTGAVNMQEVSAFAGFSLQVRARAQDLVMELARLEKQIEAARGRLLEATQARKALELLHDKQLALWRRRQERREAAELDDLTAGQYTRRMFERQHAQKMRGEQRSAGR